jgi:hypothetical protein
MPIARAETKVGMARPPPIPTIVRKNRRRETLVLEACMSTLLELFEKENWLSSTVGQLSGSCPNTRSLSAGSQHKPVKGRHPQLAGTDFHPINRCDPRLMML